MRIRTVKAAGPASFERMAVARRPPSRGAAMIAALALFLVLRVGAASAVTITEFSDGITPGATPAAIAAGPDGNLWFTESDRVGRITPAGVVTEFSTGITPGAGLAGIAAGPDGNLWFTESDRVGRITPAGVVTEFSTGITPGAGLAGIAAGPDGNLWFTEHAANRVARITPLGVVTEFATGITQDTVVQGPYFHLITPGARPDGIAAGPDGNLWFTETNRGVGRITPTGE